MATRPAAVAATTEKARARASSDELIRHAPSLGDLPLLTIAAGENISEPRWAEGQRRLAALSTSGRLIVAERISHAVAWDDPGLVIAAVLGGIPEARRPMKAG